MAFEMTTNEEEPAFIKKQISLELYRHQPDYQPGILAQDGVSNKIFIGIVGGIGTGKSFLTKEVLRRNPGLLPINTRTTRGPKPDDPAGWQTALSFSTARDAVNNGEVVNYSAIPEGNVYFTYAEDFPGKHSIGPFLPSSIDHVIKAGFERHNFVYVVEAGDLWRGFVEKSRQNMDKDIFEGRLIELLDSTQYALDNPDLFSFVENSPEPVKFERAVQNISQIAMEGSAPTLDFASAKKRIEEQRSAAKELLAA